MAPTVGALGVIGCAMITALPETEDVHPEDVNFTVKV